MSICPASVRAKLYAALEQAVARLRKKDEYGLFTAPVDPATEAANAAATAAAVTFEQGGAFTSWRWPPKK